MSSTVVQILSDDMTAEWWHRMTCLHIAHGLGAGALEQLLPGFLGLRPPDVAQGKAPADRLPHGWRVQAYVILRFLAPAHPLGLHDHRGVLRHQKQGLSVQAI